MTNSCCPERGLDRRYKSSGENGNMQTLIHQLRVLLMKIASHLRQYQYIPHCMTLRKQDGRLDMIGGDAVCVWVWGGRTWTLRTLQYCILDELD